MDEMEENALVRKILEFQRELTLEDKEEMLP
jgi:hypothetical protein